MSAQKLNAKWILETAQLLPKSLEIRTDESKICVQNTDWEGNNRKNWVAQKRSDRICLKNS